MDRLVSLATQRALRQRVTNMIQELDAVTGTDPARYRPALDKCKDIFKGEAQASLDSETYIHVLLKGGIQRPLLALLTSTVGIRPPHKAVPLTSIYFRRTARRSKPATFCLHMVTFFPQSWAASLNLRLSTVSLPTHQSSFAAYSLLLKKKNKLKE